MPQKQPLDKLCWEWAEETDWINVKQEHVKSAYRLNLGPCQLGKCRRHCKGNPYCVNCIGERVWFNEIDDTAWHDIQDPEEERRKPGMSVGLKNLGATCYVNTFLQLWFHNETVKQGIFEWRDRSVADDEAWKPDSVCAHLQVIFGLLEKSVRRYIDPSDFIQHLGLDAGQQQDAQEFSKLFLSVLEQNLADSPSQRNVIKEQFCGSYAYVTRCNHCNSASERLSDFYELDLTIQGHKTLTEALKGFLEVEKLEGDNRYMCSTCNEKRNATRAIELKVLPPVLNLQLLRFVYDLKTGSKKKLSSTIQFPEVLDMSTHLTGGQIAIYELSAVLIHRGPSAYSGHYIAHIRDQDNQGWYKFNDEEIEKIKGKSLQLGNEEDLESKQKKVGRTPKGAVSSRNAYMLVYTKKYTSDYKASVESGNSIRENQCTSSGIQNMEEETLTKPNTSRSEIFNNMKIPSTVQSSLSAPNLTCGVKSNAEHSAATSLHISKEMVSKTVVSKPVSMSQSIPGYINRFVERDNEKFQSWVDEMNEMKAGNIARGKEKQETVKAIFHDLPYSSSDGDKFEWIPMSWLTKWLNDPSTTPAIDMGRYLCHHGKIGLEQSIKMKCVSQKGSDQLYNLYGGNQRMKGTESLCMDCVKNRCKQIRTKQRISEDDKFISAAMKKNFSDENCFWVGKRSFRSWRRLALECLLEEDIPQKDEPELVDDNDKTVNNLQQDEDNMINNVTENNGNAITDNNVDRIHTVPPLDDMQEISFCNNGQFDGCKENNRKGLSDEELAVSGKKIELNEAHKRTNDAHEGTNDAHMGTNDTQKGTHETHKGSNGEHKVTTENSVDDDEETLQFNEDLLCDDHRGLEPNVLCRRMVPESVWIKLKQYFPDCPEFSILVPPCEKCLSTKEAEHQDKELNKKIAASQKAALTDLFFDRRRPVSFTPGTELFVVSSVFIDNWRAFIRDPVRTECVNVVTNSVLLCEHGGYLYPHLEESLLKSDNKVTYVTKTEWQQLKEFYPIDTEITLICLVENERKEIVIVPKVCDDCLQNRLNFEEKEIFDYENEVMYVRKNNKSEKGVKTKETILENNDDPDFSAGTARKRSLSDEPASNEPPEKLKKVTDAGKIVRKSQRHRRVRGEKEVTVSSNQTLKDLKIQIMKLFSVPPFDQNLYIDGILLSNNDSTLGELKVAPGSIINLIADEVEEDTTFLEDISKHSGIPESGFKGTNLLSAT